jgi:hypothetical protein
MVQVTPPSGKSWQLLHFTTPNNYMFIGLLWCFASFLVVLKYFAGSLSDGLCLTYEDSGEVGWARALASIRALPSPPRILKPSSKVL